MIISNEFANCGVVLEGHPEHRPCSIQAKSLQEDHHSRPAAHLRFPPQVLPTQEAALRPEIAERGRLGQNNQSRPSVSSDPGSRSRDQRDPRLLPLHHFQDQTHGAHRRLRQRGIHPQTQKERLVFATPIEYDHYGFKNPEQHYLDCQQKIREKMPSATFVRSDVDLFWPLF